jgi:SAM-dependent methyltransferase
MCTPDLMAWKQLSHDEVLKLDICHFLAYLGKRMINPGGVAGRDLMLDLLQPKPDNRILKIGGGSGQIACHIAQTYGCKVTAIDGSSRSVSQARALVRRRGLTDRVRCEVGDITDLKFNDNTFDAVICQAVLMFVPHQPALSEVRRVMKEEGMFAGLEYCWKKLPPDAVRDATNRVFGAETVDFHSLYGWLGTLREARFEAVQATEHPFRLLGLNGFLEDEGWANSLRIAGKVMRRRANRLRMAEIREHVSTHTDYFSYVVLSGSKQAACNVQRKFMGRAPK